MDVDSQILLQSDWDMLSKALESFRGLKRVDFVWEMHQDDWEWLEQHTPLDPAPFTIDSFVWETGPKTIKELLPKLYSRGILHFSTTGPEDPPYVVNLLLIIATDISCYQVVGVLTCSADIEVISPGCSMDCMNGSN